MSKKGAALIALAAGGSAALAGAGVTGVASYFARRIVTPSDAVDDAVVRSYTDLTITLDADDQTTSPGRYSLWQDGLETHIRIGDVLGVAGGEVIRELEAVDYGTLHEGPARVSGHYFAPPPHDDLGVEITSTPYDGPLGRMPAWQTRVEDSARWAVLVHGRSALRAECLRAVPTLNALGFNTLIPGYRNDRDSLPAPDGRYGLGLTEWQDIDAAIDFAVNQGATEIVPFGWSMGGAIVLQLLDRSRNRRLITRAVLDAPVVDWADVIAFQAALNKVPAAVGRLGQSMMRSKWHRPLIGLAEPMQFSRADWVSRAAELTTPILLIHSKDDDYVPYAPSAALAAARPDLVQLETFEVARHCREWNVDSERWERVVRAFCGPQRVA